MLLAEIQTLRLWRMHTREFSNGDGLVSWRLKAWPAYCDTSQ